MPAPLHRNDRIDRLALAILAAAVLTPLLLWRQDFAALHWLGDEWDQLDQIEKHGFRAWTFGFFGENFSPLFKLVWGGATLLGGGSYFALVVLVWLLHAANAALLAAWMRQAGGGRTATATALVGFGLAACHVETLTWTVQLITVQGIFFFLAAGCWWSHREAAAGWDRRSLLLLAMLVGASTFSFARGALTGGALALATLLVPAAAGETSRARGTTLQLLTVCLVPALVLTALMTGFAPGNHHRLAESGLAAPAEYAAWYLGLNPFHRFFDFVVWGPHTAFILGIGKLVLFIAGWRLAGPRLRWMLAALLLFELGNAALLGIGRFHTGLGTTISSRYQYISLLCTMPFAGICLEGLIARVLPGRTGQAAGGVALVLALAVFCLRAWPGQVRPWADDSRRVRHLLAPGAGPVAEGAITGLEWIPNDRARELVRRYQLH